MGMFTSNITNAKPVPLPSLGANQGGYIEPVDGTTGSEVWFFGDSITLGVGASPSTNRWTTQLSTLKGWTEVNEGFSGYPLCVNTCISHLDITLIPTKTATRRFLFIAAGNNDIQIDSLQPSDYQSNLISWISAAATKGWNAGRIIIISNFYAEFTAGSFTGCNSLVLTPTRRMGFRDVMQYTANTNGCYFINTYDPMKNNGGIALLNDTIHPNNTGHTFIANNIIGPLMPT